MRVVPFLLACGVGSSALAQCDWRTLADPGAEVFEGLFEPEVRSLLEADLPGGRFVFAGGLFTRIDGVDVESIAAWDGGAWRSLGGGLAITGPARFENPPVVKDMIVFDAAGQPELYVIGAFNTADPLGAAVTTEQIARWDGEQWQPVGGGLGPVNPFGAGPQPSAMEVYEGELYVGGLLWLDAGSPADSLARWDGSRWSDVGGAFRLATGEVGRIEALAVFDGDLYAGGWFATAPGGVVASNLARWDGSRWHAVGGGIDGEVWALGGHAGALFVGGRFENAGGDPAANIARWDGAAWSPLGPGIELAENGGVYTLHSFGGALYAGGAFDRAGGGDAHNLARWDGQWSAVDGPITGSAAVPWILPVVHTLATGALAGEGLLVGGFFDEVAPGVRAGSLAKLACAACYPDFDGDGALTIFDFLGFQNAFDAGSDRADCDADGSLTIFDFLCFQNAFDAGC
jgi:hypothetical protein